MGVTMVCASRYAVTTHEMCAKPPNSPTIVGKAVATIVESRAAKSITSNSPPKTTSTLSCEARAVRSAEAAACIESHVFSHSASPLHYLCPSGLLQNLHAQEARCLDSQQPQQLARNQSVHD